MPAFDLDLDGQRAQLHVSAAELERVHLPLLQQMARQSMRHGGRFLVLLAGPPGSGKTVLANLWQQLAVQHDVGVLVQSLPMDGFHYPNAKLDAQSVTVDGVSMPLRRIKGRPETYDFLGMQNALRSIRAGRPTFWPRYDRTIHDPIPDAMAVAPEGIIVVEGLYLLLDLPGWRELRAHANLGVFLECPEDILRADLVLRKERQGRCHADAVRHFNLVDHYTFEIVTRHRHGIDVLLRVGPERQLTLAANSSP